MSTTAVKTFERVGQRILTPKNPKSFANQQMGTWLKPEWVNPHLHVPKPGQVQYYRPESTPFIPNEIMAQIRVPTEVAHSALRTRYLSRIRELIIQYTLEQNIKNDYFTGEEIDVLGKKLSEMETLNSASDQIKQLSDSGAINSIRENVNELHGEAQQIYYELMANFGNIITAANQREDEILDAIMTEYEQVKGLKGHQYAVITRGVALSARNYKYIKNYHDPEHGIDLKSQMEELEGLMSLRDDTVSKQYSLQEIWVEHVERDSETEETLRNLHIARSRGENTQYDHALKSQLQEVSNSILTAQDIFERYAQALAVRTKVFDNYLEDVPAHVAEDRYKNGLLRYLGSELVIKESRTKWQKEQQDRYIISTTNSFLNRQGDKMENFARQYALMIELQIDYSNNGLSPKIEANYDVHEAARIKPISQQVVWFWFKGQQARNYPIGLFSKMQYFKGSFSWVFSQVILGSVRYPSEKIRDQYMRIFGAR